jgi:hypothetical protein
MRLKIIAECELRQRKTSGAMWKTRISTPAGGGNQKRDYDYDYMVIVRRQPGS